MKNLLVVFCFVLSFVFVKGQNLVSNPSFEQHSSCPTNVSQIALANDWYTLLSTPDYFNTCATAPICSIPNNGVGYQNTITLTDSAYAGFFAYLTPSFCCIPEIMGCQLTNPLNIGQKYYVSFKVSAAYGMSKCFSNKLGALFSTIPYSTSNPPPINNYSQIYTNTTITETTHWTTISGSIIADSAYQYMEISSFFNPINTNIICINAVTFGDSLSYYYVDNVCVSADSGTCEVEVNVGIVGSILNNQFLMYPNPAKNSLTVYLDGINDKTYLKIYNWFGELKIEKEVFIATEMIDITDLQDGIYIVQIQTEKKLLTRKLIITNN